MRETTGLRLRIFALVLAGALLVAIGVALLLSNTISQRSRASRSQRLNAALIRVIAIDRLAVDAETGLRGYVITARPEFLQPTRAAQAALPLAIAQLRDSLAQEPQDRAASERVIGATRDYFETYVPSVEVLVRQRPASARSVAVTQLGKTEVDHVRQLTAAAERRLSAQATESERAAHHAANEAVAESIAVLIVLTVVTLALGGYLGRLAVQRDLARQRSDATSRTLQRSILPAGLPHIDGVDLAVRFAPAGDRDLVGGDFYDVFAQRPGVWSIVLGDVCGKGAEAAAVSAMARWTLRSLAGSEVRPGAALHFLNQAMLRQDLGRRFLTVALLELVVGPHRALVRVTCAGHPAPVLVPAGGGAEEVDAHGDLIGIWPSVRLRGAEFVLEPGDGLVLYTDGITDTGPEVAEPPDRVLRSAAPGLDADGLADTLLAVAEREPSPRRDDVAIIALRFRGSGDSVESRTAVPAATADR